jgi:hypothetical protein
MQIAQDKNLITSEYQKLNKELHDSNKHYGTSGASYLKDIFRIMDMFKSNDILDYGCGKSTLQHNLPFEIKQYDPAVPKYANPPSKADIVVCTDVLEHIEPECLESVLKDILRLSKKGIFLSIATRPAKKFLSDGRNAHLIVQPAIWWLNILTSIGYEILMFHNQGLELKLICQSVEGETND